jgi:hypothetical protein
MGPQATYREKLLHPKWQKRRTDILRRDKFRCVWCGAKDRTLDVHHKRYAAWGSNPWEAPDEWLVTACRDCHDFVTKGAREATEMVKELGPAQLQTAMAFIAMQFSGDTRPLCDLLAGLHVERSRLIDERYSKARHMRVEEIDALEEHTWALLDATTPRTYGAP